MRQTAALLVVIVLLVGVWKLGTWLPWPPLIVCALVGVAYAALRLDIWAKELER
jgi:hypothetical protein